ncbi:MAG TPA: APC family permease [Bryobacteraceae bacterium]|nr:APC family permease [Bryobacteraceae bacterium]
MTAGSGSETNETPAAHLKRALGVWDLTWLSIVAIANLNVVPVIAAAGATTMWLWVAALLFFFLPQGIGVIELSHRFPQEGGVYAWTKEMFGDLHGFLCGWCYWTCNMFFIPTLLFYLLGTAAYIGGGSIARLSENSLIFGAVAIGLIWLTALANILGIGVGKWVNNIGGLGTIVAASLLIALGVMAVTRFGVTLPASSFRFGHLDWSVLSTFGLVCFALVGLELGCVMGDEIRDPRRSVPRGVLYGGVLSGIQYLGATLALLLAVPQRDMKVLQGVVQAVDKMTGKLGTTWALLPIVLLVAVSTIGATSAWLSGSARILFVSGIDRYLPKILGRLHPKYATPYVALIGISALCSCLIAMSFAGETSVREAYMTLLDMAVVLQMIAYFYVYASLARIAFAKTAGEGRFAPWQIRFAAISGLGATAVGIIVAFVPSRQVDSVWRFEIKMFLSCAVFLATAAGLFIYYSRRKVDAAAIPAAVEV